MTVDPHANDADFVVGTRYDFYTSDGTCYEGAEFVRGNRRDGFFIKYGATVPTLVFIAPHEYDWADDHDPNNDDATDYFK